MTVAVGGFTDNGAPVPIGGGPWPIGTGTPPVGQPDGPFVMWDKLYVSGDTPDVTMGRFNALGKPQMLVFGSNGPYSLTNKGYNPSLNYASTWLNQTLLTGMGGQGVGQTVIVCPAQLGAIPQPTGPEGTPTALARIKQNDGAFANMWGLELHGTVQSLVSMVHGLTVYHSTIDVVTVKDNKWVAFGEGIGGAPPQETFHEQLHPNPARTPYTQLISARNEYDGRAVDTGALVGGVGWTFQECANGQSYSDYSHDNRAGSLAVLYRCQNITISDMRCAGGVAGQSAFNAEYCDNIHLIRPNLTVPPGHGPHITFSNTPWSNGRMSGNGNGQLIIDDPICNPAFPDGLPYIQSWGGSYGTTQQLVPIMRELGQPKKFVWIDPSNTHRIING